MKGLAILLLLCLTNDAHGHVEADDDGGLYVEELGERNDFISIEDPEDQMVKDDVFVIQPDRVKRQASSQPTSMEGGSGDFYDDDDDDYDAGLKAEGGMATIKFFCKLRMYCSQVFQTQI